MEKSKEIVISDGFYRQRNDKRKFEVRIYKLKETGEMCCLAPLWVSESPETWERIESKVDKQLKLTL